MENYSTEEFEDILKEKSEQYMLYPSDRVWSNIFDKLHPFRRVKYISLMLLFFIAATTAIILSNEESKFAIQDNVRIADAFIKNRHLEELGAISEHDLKAIRAVASEKKYTKNTPAKKEAITQPRKLADIDLTRESPIMTLPNQLPLTYTTLNQSANNKDTKLDNKEEKKHSITSALDNVIEKAKKIKQNASWQFYVTPSIGYRSLSGQASKTVYQYTQYFLSTNAPFARNVKDAVNHSPGVGLEIGTSLFYPITKRLTFKAGIQANYNQYQIRAFSSVPEIATCGMNDFGAGSVPINAVSVYRNNAGYSNSTLRNEHYMLSIPIGFDYRVLGNKKINLSLASTIQPSYVFANYSYLISTNLKNYAKAPSLNRILNINAGMEASLNINSGSYRWGIAPQYRYQLLSSFKDRYPIRENLMDFGIKLGIIKTIN